MLAWLSIARPRQFHIAGLLELVAAGAHVGALTSPAVLFDCVARYDGRRCCRAERADFHLGLRSQAVEWACALTSASVEVDDRLAHVAVAYFAHSLGNDFVTHDERLFAMTPEQSVFVPDANENGMTMPMLLPSAG